MKTIIQKSLLLAAAYYTLALVGCIKNNCNCRPPKTGKFHYTSITATNVQYTFPSDSIFSVNPSGADTLPKNRFGLRFQFAYETAFQPCRKSTGPGLFNTAFACSCAEDNFTSKDTIKRIFLRTLEDFDASHPAGSYVTAYFNTAYQNYSSPMVSFGEAFVPSYYDFNNQYTAQGNKVYDLYLKTEPASGRKVAFELTVEYTDGTRLTSASTPVYLK